jgi:hypothetical protein
MKKIFMLSAALMLSACGSDNKAIDSNDSISGIFKNGATTIGVIERIDSDGYWINGSAFDLSSTYTRINELTRSALDLSVGMHVTLHTDINGDRAVETHSLATGEITSIDTDNRRIIVNGQSVYYDYYKPTHFKDSAINALEVGNYIDVQGYIFHDQYHATFVETLNEHYTNETRRIFGQVDTVDTNTGEIVVNGYSIDALSANTLVPSDMTELMIEKDQWFYGYGNNQSSSVFKMEEIYLLPNSYAEEVGTFNFQGKVDVSNNQLVANNIHITINNANIESAIQGAGELYATFTARKNDDNIFVMENIVAVSASFNEITGVIEQYDQDAGVLTIAGFNINTNPQTMAIDAADGGASTFALGDVQDGDFVRITFNTFSDGEAASAIHRMDPTFEDLQYKLVGTATVTSDDRILLYGHEVIYNDSTIFTVDNNPTLITSYDDFKQYEADHNSPVRIAVFGYVYSHGISTALIEIVSD